MRTLLVVVGSSLLLACSGDKDDAGETDDTDLPPAGTLTATVAASPYVPAVAIVSFSGSGDGFVEYGLGGVFDRATPISSGTVHQVPVIGLKAGQTYDWRAVLVAADGTRSESAPSTFVVPPAPAPALTVTAGDSASFDGFILLSVIDRVADASWLTFVDADGDYVWWIESPGNGIISARFADNGTSVLYGEYNNDEGIDSGHVVRVGTDGRTRLETRLLRGHHDFVEHDDGEIAFVSMEFDTRFEDEAGAEITWGSDSIRKGPEGMTDASDPVLIFDTFADHTAREPEFVCSHVEPTAAIIGPKLGEDAVLEWSHGNSLVYLPTENAYYLNARYTDWLLKIDAATGAVLWELNGTGVGGDFAGTGVLWSHSHLSDLWDGGALVFDNGDHHVPAESRIVQVSWDESTMTAGIDLEIDGPPGFASAIGDARRMPDGNILGAWGNLGEVTVHDPTGALVWQAGLGAPLFAARARYTESLYTLPDED